MTVPDIFIVELEAWDVVEEEVVTLRYAQRLGYTTTATDTPADTAFDARLKDFSIERWMFDRKKTSGRSAVGFGNVVLLNGDGGVDDIANPAVYSVDGRAITIRRGPASGGAYPGDFDVVLAGSMQYVETTPDELIISIRDNQSHLVGPLQDTKFAGDNVLPDGLEGTADDLKGKPKPVLIGTVKNIRPPCVNTSKLIYQFADDEADSLDAVYDRGVALQSQIGPTWDHVAVQFAGNNIAVEYFAHTGLFVMVGLNAAVDGYRIATSPDGETWTFRALPISAANILITSIHSYGSLCIIGGVGTGPSDCRFFWSSDGVVWRESTSDQMGNSRPYGIAVGPGEGASGADRWVAVGADAQINSSDDGGVTWVDRTPAGFSAEIIRDVGYGDGIFVAVGAAGKVETSPDAVTWTARTSGFGTDIVLGVAYSDTLDLWVIVGTNGELATSPDGTTWTMRTSGFGTDTISDVRWVGELSAFMARGVNGSDSKFTMSSDGVNWTDYSTGLGALLPTSGAQQIAYNTSTGVTLLVTDTGVYRSEPFAWTYADATDLEDDTLAPAPGAVGILLDAAGSYFRLGSAPEGEVTCDATEGAAASNRYAAQLFTKTLTRAGFSAGEWNTSDITTLDAAADYQCGFWTDEETTFADVLDKIAASVGAAWFVDQAGVYRIKQLLLPTGTPAMAFVAADIVKGRFRQVRPSESGGGVPTYQRIVRYAKNHTVQTSGLGVVTAARLAFLASEWREASDTDNTILTANLLAKSLVEDSLLANAADADDEATRRQVISGIQRRMFELDVALDDETFALDLNNVSTLTHSRFGLSGGEDFRILGIHMRGENRELTLTVWG